MHPFSANLCLHYTSIFLNDRWGNNLREDDDLREAIIFNISHFSELFSSLIIFAGSQCFST